MPGEREGLKVPTIAVRAELMLDGGAIHTVELFVAEHQAHEYRRQLVADLLEAPTAFVPMRRCDDGAGAPGEIELLNKDALVWLRVALAGGQPPVEERGDPGDAGELYDELRAVRVELAASAPPSPPLRGEILYSAAAAGHSRVADYLNAPGRLFRLWTGDHLYLVNKRFVLRVVEI